MKFTCIKNANREIRQLRKALRMAEALIGVSMEQVASLKAKLLILAKLAAETPQFDNPILVWEAQTLRDEILKRGGQ